jgi:hypothetical protein
MLLVMALLVALAGVASSGVILSSHNAAAYSGIAVEFDYPRYAGLNQTVPCALTIRGGPAGDMGGNFSYEIEVDGENIQGFVASPRTATSETGVFRLNLTMPEQADQTIFVEIIATSEEWTGTDSVNQTFEFEIKVVTPILITAVVHNRGVVDAIDVTASFYADGDLLGTQDFSIAAGDSKVLYYNWTFASIEDGKHTITVSIDDQDKIVEFNDGNNVYTRTIYVGQEGNIIGGVLMVAVIFLAIVVTLTYFQKPAKKKKF